MKPLYRAIRAIGTALAAFVVYRWEASCDDAPGTVARKPRRRTGDAPGWPGAPPAQPSQLARESPLPPGFGRHVVRRSSAARR